MNDNNERHTSMAADGRRGKRWMMDMEDGRETRGGIDETTDEDDGRPRTHATAYGEQGKKRMAGEDNGRPRMRSVMTRVGRRMASEEAGRGGRLAKDGGEEEVGQRPTTNIDDHQRMEDDNQWPTRDDAYRWAEDDQRDDLHGWTEDDHQPTKDDGRRPRGGAMTGNEDGWMTMDGQGRKPTLGSLLAFINLPHPFIHPFPPDANDGSRSTRHDEAQTANRQERRTSTNDERPYPWTMSAQRMVMDGAYGEQMKGSNKTTREGAVGSRYGQSTEALSISSCSCSACLVWSCWPKNLGGRMGWAADRHWAMGGGANKSFLLVSPPIL
ncbi:hypothetical protein BDN70DRAFT_901100 [Pholiota conissans]|uniref:Uncharacterized protein n=1 Tax=Pholiota conissans TaxID=109636 RepID=A0A9P5YQB4_9AGAR|nr:hypothetical protein BDN70DRAFT_901100 [Pholiota conissans]